MNAFEVNFDGLVGPTHNYAGLSYGNVASMLHGKQVSNPRSAALQGLKKMQRLMQLGIKQAILPPHPRPNIHLLRSLGFFGTDIEVLTQARKHSNTLFRASYSSSGMWTANTATVTPSLDSEDRRVHFTISNLITNAHRAQEAEHSYIVFNKIFSDHNYFQVHPPLFACSVFADEGAANQNRFCARHGLPGVQMFVYGQEGFAKYQTRPLKYPARQTKEAFLAISRLHHLNENSTLFVQQNPNAIDAGVFHNDVISVVNENVFLYHEEAFENSTHIISNLKEKLNFKTYFLPIKTSDLTLQDAVQSYLFNSQIVTLPTSKMLIIAPLEVQQLAPAYLVLKKILSDPNPIDAFEFIDCNQSMQNGGGPACLRLRVVLTEEELKHCHPHIFFTEDLYQTLENWILKYYRDRLSSDDFLDKKFLEESNEALDVLTKILHLGSIYPFQK